MTIRYGNSVVGPDTIIGESVILGAPGKNELDLLRHNAMEKAAGARIGHACILRSHTVIYSGAVLGDRVQTGHYVLVREGTVVGDDTLLGTGTIVEDRCRIGRRVSIQSRVYIPTFTVIEDGVFIGPNAVFTNDKRMGRGDVRLEGATVGASARIGANATILPNIRIGPDSVVGAGAVVTRDVPRATIVAGVPARRLGDVPPAERVA